MNGLSKAAKALIITWVMIGLFVAGVVGFYFGRKTAPKAQSTVVDRQLQPADQQPAQQGGATQGTAPAGGPTSTGSVPTGGSAPAGGSTQPAAGQESQQKTQQSR